MTTDKVRVEQLLVADGNAALVADGVALVNTATGAFNISNEQIGFFTCDTHVADDDGSEKRVYVAQGTEYSASPSTAATYPLINRPVEKSMPINLGRNVKVSKTVGNDTVTSSSWVIGEVNGQTDEINVSDNTKYALTVAFDGHRIDYFNARNQPAMFVEFTSPTYSTSTVYTTEVRQRDHLVSSIVDKINQQSQVYPGRVGGAPVIALAIHSVTGGTTGTALADMDGVGNVGSTITLGYTPTGNRITYTMTTTFVNTIARIIADAATLGLSDFDIASRAVPVLLSTAPAGSQAATDVTATTTIVAGTGAQNADVILIIALDDTTATYDRVEPLKPTITVGETDGFESTVNSIRAAKAFEGIGLGRQIELKYQSYAALNKQDGVQAPSGYLFEYPSDVDTTATYTTYSILHSTGDEATNGLPSVNPYITHICVETGDTTTSAALDGVFNNWAINFDTRLELAGVSTTAF